MSIVVEVNMKIPGLTLKTSGQPSRAVDNSSVRFLKTIEVPSVPKVSSLLNVTVRPNIILTCTVTRAEWNDAREIFIISCTHAEKRIWPEAYLALIKDPDWRTNQLP